MSWMDVRTVEFLSVNIVNACDRIYFQATYKTRWKISYRLDWIALHHVNATSVTVTRPIIFSDDSV